MEYRALASTFEDLSATASRLAKIDLLAELFSSIAPDLLAPVIQLTRGRVFEARESGDLGISSALAHEAIVRATGVPADQIESWWRERGDLGLAAERAVERNRQTTLVNRDLTVRRVYDGLRSLAALSGSGSRNRRVAEFAGLIADADPLEARYLVRTVGGAMRLGVGEGIIRDAIARAFLADDDASIAAVKRAYEVTNDFGVVATVAREEGIRGLADLDVELFRPIKPMLAQQATDLDTAIAELGDAIGSVLIEAKYDGMRAKMHGRADRYRLYSRRLEEVTEQFPDVVEALGSAVRAGSFIIEAEVVGVDPDTHRPLPFQELSRRITRKHDIDAVVAEIPVRTFAFDLLYVNGESLLAHPLRDRIDALESVLVPVDASFERAEHVITDSVNRASAFRATVSARGHEGIMVKNLDATYEPGSRVGYQQKVKRTLEPLDLVVTRAKWSEGRKSEFLGRPYLACRGRDGELLEVGRMHTGFSDEQLVEFTALVEPLIEEIDGREAILTPEVVLEVECAEIQRSPTYDSGYALRFPRLRRIRHDLDGRDIDTLERIEELHACS